MNKLLFCIAVATILLSSCGPSKTVVLEQQKALASQLFAGEKYAEALDIYTKILNDNTADSAMYHNVTICNSKLGNCEQTIVYGQKTLNYGASKDILSAMAECYLKQSNHESNMISLCESYSDNMRTILGSAYNDSLAVWYLVVNPSQISSVYSKVISASVRSMCFPEYFKQQKDVMPAKELRSVCRKALTDNESQVVALDYLAVQLYTEAEEQYNKCMADYNKKKNATTYAYLKRDLKRISADYRSAQTYFEKLRKLQPDNKNYIKYLINVYSRLDQNDKAKRLTKLL